VDSPSIEAGHACAIVCNATGQDPCALSKTVAHCLRRKFGHSAGAGCHGVRWANGPIRFEGRSVQGGHCAASWIVSLSPMQPERLRSLRPGWEKSCRRFRRVVSRALGLFAANSGQGVQSHGRRFLKISVNRRGGRARWHAIVRSDGRTRRRSRCGARNPGSNGSRRTLARG